MRLNLTESRNLTILPRNQYLALPTIKMSRPHRALISSYSTVVKTKAFQEPSIYRTVNQHINIGYGMISQWFEAIAPFL